MKITPTLAIVDLFTEKIVWILPIEWKEKHDPTLLNNGNILVFVNNYSNDASRVIEINPLTQKITWEYKGAPDFPFYTQSCGSHKRLPNGNTMITIGCGGIMIEVTREHELVWEYVSPYFASKRYTNLVYRAYRVPYEWVPQLDLPEEIPVLRLNASEYSISGHPPKDVRRLATIEGTRSADSDVQTCVLPEDN